MKIPITDKFLWMIYDLIEGIDRAYDFVAPRTMNEAICRDSLKLRREWERNEGRKNFSHLVYYLKKKGLIRIKNLEAKKAIILTKEGMEKVLKISLKMVNKKKRKDGKWIMLLFDIPEKKRSFRDLLRKDLHLLGYKMLQRSVWVCPYDVLKETEAILRQYSLDSYIKLFLIEEVNL